MRDNGRDHVSILSMQVPEPPAAVDSNAITIKAGRPPNWEAIARAIPASTKLGTLFTYGNVIYVTDGKPVPRSIIAHETIHVRQQEIMGRDEWWERYLVDREFRFGCELEAHRVELAVALTEGGRRHRRKVAGGIARRLSGPLYGHVCTLRGAKALLGIGR